MNGEYPTSSEIDLVELWRIIWTARWKVFAITGLAALLGITYALLATQWFRSEVVMVTADRQSVPSRFGQLGGLASLAGINLGSSGSPEPVAILKSREFAQQFIAEEGLVDLLLEGEGISSGQVDIREAVKIFDENVRSVSEDKKNGTITLGIQWRDPELAATWANAYVVKLNERLRLQALEESQLNVEFLQREIAQTDIVQLRQSLGTVLESEMQKLLFARGSESYAFKVVDKATPPLRRSKPNRPVVVLAALFFGFILSLVFVLSPRVFATKT